MTNETQLSRLRELAAQSEETIFERVKIAAALMTDFPWVESIGGQHAAIGHLRQFFKDLHGAIELEQLLEVYQEFPTIKQWRDYDCNLQRLWWNGVQGERLKRTREQRAKEEKEEKRKKQSEAYQAKKNRPKERAACSVSMDLRADNIIAATPKDLAETIRDTIAAHPQAETVWVELQRLMAAQVRRRA